MSNSVLKKKVAEYGEMVSALQFPLDVFMWEISIGKANLTEPVCYLSCVTTHLLQHSAVCTTWLYYLRSLLFSATGVSLDFVFCLSWAALSESFTLWLFATQNRQEKLWSIVGCTDKRLGFVFLNLDFLRNDCTCFS